MTNSLCRLCMNNNFTPGDLCELSKSTRLISKIYICTNVKIVMDHNYLPTKICKHCKKQVEKFYAFKQKCLETDAKLKNIEIKYEVKDMLEVTFENTNENSKSNSSTEELAHCDYNSIENSLSDENIQNHENCKRHENFQHFDNHLEIEGNLEIIPKNNTTQCEHCGDVFKTTILFQKHLCEQLQNKSAKRFQCTLCNKFFTRKQHLMTHMLSHSGIKSFTCEICGLSVTTRHTLIRHMKVHCDEKKYTCPTCGRSFKRSFELYPHIKTHSGVRPYKCKLCDKDYTSHGGLRKHSKFHKTTLLVK